MTITIDGLFSKLFTINNEKLEEFAQSGDITKKYKQQVRIQLEDISKHELRHLLTLAAEEHSYHSYEFKLVMDFHHHISRSSDRVYECGYGIFLNLFTWDTAWSDPVKYSIILLMNDQEYPNEAIMCGNPIEMEESKVHQHSSYKPPYGNPKTEFKVIWKL